MKDQDQAKRDHKRQYGIGWRKSHPLYATHEAMLQRCGQKHGCSSASNLRRYRDRGIRVCAEWVKFSQFEAWALSHGWERGLTIDRIDNDRGYSPDNCRFVSPKEQARHRLGNLIVMHGGVRMSLAEAVERSGSGIAYKTVHGRLRRGWTVQDALLRPLKVTKAKKN